MAITSNEVLPVAPNYNDTYTQTGFIIKEFSDIDVITADTTQFTNTINSPRLARWDSAAAKMKLCGSTNRPTHIFLPGSVSGTVASFLALGSRAYQVGTLDDLQTGDIVYTADDGLVTKTPSNGAYPVGYSRSVTPATIGEAQGSLVLFQSYVAGPAYSA